MNRFSQKDVLRGTVEMPLSLNRYAFVVNDPVNYADPSGLVPSAAIAAVEAAKSSKATSKGYADTGGYENQTKPSTVSAKNATTVDYPVNSSASYGYSGPTTTTTTPPSNSTYTFLPATQRYGTTNSSSPLTGLVKSSNEVKKKAEDATQILTVDDLINEGLVKLANAGTITWDNVGYGSTTSGPDTETAWAQFNKHLEELQKATQGIVMPWNTQDFWLSLQMGLQETPIKVLDVDYGIVFILASLGGADFAVLADTSSKFDEFSKTLAKPFIWMIEDLIASFSSNSKDDAAGDAASGSASDASSSGGNSPFQPKDEPTPPKDTPTPAPTPTQQSQSGSNADLYDGIRMTTNEALEAAEAFLGKGYVDMGNG